MTDEFEGVLRIIRQIEDAEKAASGQFIYRGTPSVHSADADGVCSSLYRNEEYKGNWNDHFRPCHLEELRVKKARERFPQGYLPSTRNIEILTDIRHHKGEVNLVDFTYDPNIALFFACGGATDKDGEVVMLDIENIPLVSNIDYKEVKDNPDSVMLLEPAATSPISQNRAISQRSVFAYSPIGYIPQNYVQSITIPASVKTKILAHLAKHRDVTSRTIYPDFLGFIDSEDDHDSARSNFYKGLAVGNKGDYQEAIACFEKAIMLDSQFALAYYNRGVAKSALEDYQGALADYDKTIELKPIEKAYYNRGVANSNLGNHQSAIEDYEKVIQLNPNNARAYQNRGLAKDDLRDLQGAIADYDKAIELDPKYAKAYNNRGAARRDAKNYQGALADFDMVINLDPHSALAYFNRGTVKLLMGKIKNSMVDFREATRIGLSIKDFKF